MTGKKKKNKKRDNNIISMPRTFEHIVSVKPRDGGLQVKKEKVNSLMPISKVPFVNENDENGHSSPTQYSEIHSKGLFGRLKKVKIIRCINFKRVVIRCFENFI